MNTIKNCLIAEGSLWLTIGACIQLWPAVVALVVAPMVYAHLVAVALTWMLAGRARGEWIAYGACLVIATANLAWLLDYAGAIELWWLIRLAS